MSYYHNSNALFWSSWTGVSISVTDNNRKVKIESVSSLKLKRHNESVKDDGATARAIFGTNKIFLYQSKHKITEY